MGRSRSLVVLLFFFFLLFSLTVIAEPDMEIFKSDPYIAANPTTTLYFDPDSYFSFSGDTLTLTINGTTRQTWTTAVTVDYLLLETGDYLLLENGDKLILEG